MLWGKTKYSRIIELFVNKYVMWSLCDVVYKGKLKLETKGNLNPYNNKYFNE